MTMYLHEFVAQYIPNPNNYKYVEHINGDLFDNTTENLRWTDIKPEGYPEDSKMMKKQRHKNMTSKQKSKEVFKFRG